jgi:hypothetical protein
MASEEGAWLPQGLPALGKKRASLPWGRTGGADRREGARRPGRKRSRAGRGEAGHEGGASPATEVQAGSGGTAEVGISDEV